MLHFGAVKCGLFYARVESFSIKLLCEIRIIGVKLVNYGLIVQISVQYRLNMMPFRGPNTCWRIIHIERNEISITLYKRTS